MPERMIPKKPKGIFTQFNAPKRGIHPSIVPNNERIPTINPAVAIS
jgi:hypothetical protein